MDLFAKIVDLFTEIVDLFSKRVVLQNPPNPPGYRPDREQVHPSPSTIHILSHNKT